MEIMSLFPLFFGIFNFFCLFLLSRKKNKRMLWYSGKNECRWNRWSSSWERNVPMLNTGRWKLVSDTQRYVLSTDLGMSSWRSQRYARLILQMSWSKFGLNTSPSEAGSRPKGANGQHAMQKYNSTHIGASRVYGQNEAKKQRGMSLQRISHGGTTEDSRAYSKRSSMGKQCQWGAN